MESYRCVREVKDAIGIEYDRQLLGLVYIQIPND